MTNIERHGVVVRNWPPLMITHDNRRLQLTQRQADFLGTLVPGLGHIMVTAQVIQKMGLPASTGASVISDEFFVLEKKMPEIGLKLRFVPKMGYSLSKE